MLIPWYMLQFFTAKGEKGALRVPCGGELVSYCLLYRKNGKMQKRTIAWRGFWKMTYLATGKVIVPRYLSP